MDNLLNVSKKRRFDRTFHEIRNKNQILEVIDKYLKNSLVKISEFPEDITAKISIPQNNQVVNLEIEEPLPPEYKIMDNLSVYAIYNRYIELSLVKQQFNGRSGIFLPSKVKIANNYRRDPRIAVLKEEYIAENFFVSKEYLKPHSETVCDIVVQGFHHIKSEMEKEIPNCQFFFHQEIPNNKEIQAVKKMGKPLYVQNTNRMNQDTLPEFIDYEKYLGTSYEKRIQRLKEKGTVSILAYPVCYRNLVQEEISIGIFDVKSNDDEIPLTIIPKLASLAEKMCSKIQQLNTVNIDIQQKITNISKTGIQINIQNEELAHYLATNPEEILMDIRPNSFYQFTFFGKVMNMVPDDGIGFFVGIQLKGSEKKKFDLEKWHQFIDLYINK